MRIIPGPNFWLRVTQQVVIDCNCGKRFFVSQHKKLIECPRCKVVSPALWVHSKITGGAK